MDSSFVEDLFNLFSFNTCELALVAFLGLAFLVQVYFYLSYYRLPYVTARKRSDEVIPVSDAKVSVIISSENEAERLSEILPVILEQNYSNYEVIVINDGSTDETEYVIDSLKLKYNNLYSTYLPYSYDKKFGRRKLAYTLGAKAAKGDILLFTEPHSCPVSANWIRDMVGPIKDAVEVVLGVSFFEKNETRFNRIARFDNHLFTMQYVYRALKNKPFTGVYRNVAFKKNLFFEHKGFASFLGLENGEDVFINQIVNKGNTAVSLSQDSFTATDLDSYPLWKRIKKNCSLARSCYKNVSRFILSLELSSRSIFYLLFVALVAWSIVNSSWGLLIISVVLFLIRLLIQLIVLNKGSNYFGSGKFYFSVIPLDILQPFFNAGFKTRSRKLGV